MTQRARDPRFFAPLWTAEQARGLDQATIQQVGIDGYVLMEHAGKAVAEACFHLNKTSPEHPVLVFAGPGNNGGDGWVAARHLWSMGHTALVVSTISPSDLEGDAASAAQNYLQATQYMGWRISGLDSPWLLLKDAKDTARTLQAHRPRVVVDALLGTGLSRPIEGPLAALIEAIQHGFRGLAHKPKVLAVDVPTGLFADGSRSTGPYLKADVTITFGGKKLCHALSPTCFECGTVCDVEIGLLAAPERLAGARAYMLKRLPNLLRHLLPPPTPTVHKGRFGHVGVLVGAPEMQGAARLAAYAAHRSSSGKVSLVGGQQQLQSMTTDMPETLKALLPQTPQDISKLFKGFSALVMGPGFPQTPQSKQAVKEMLKIAIAADTPTVVDAGGLQALAPLANELRTSSSKGLLICTPHPKEAAQILEQTTEEVQNNRLAALDALCRLPINEKCPTIWVLKGACPMVGEMTSAPGVVLGGNSPLAVGGSGDVLAGMIATLLERVPDPFLATVAAVYAHQEAGERLTQKGLTTGFLAREIADEAQQVLFTATQSGQP